MLARVLSGEGPLVESAEPEGQGGFRAVAAAVTSPRRIVGALCAGFEPPSRRERPDLAWAADAHAQLASLCISPDAALPELLGSAGLDPLTGCLSYAGALEVLEAEIRRSQRRGHRLSCCMLDIDGFKRLNDRWGHVEGNRVLAVAGEGLRSAARRYDAVGRFGGDEFIVVLPETDVDKAGRVGERLREGLRSVVAGATTLPIDASVGVAEWNGQGTALELIEATDQALRSVKAQGGGRVATQQPVAAGANGAARRPGRFALRLVRSPTAASELPGEDGRTR
jgi:diguanylate cyclase (GGDEF)-like protein